MMSVDVRNCNLNLFNITFVILLVNMEFSQTNYSARLCAVVVENERKICLLYYLTEVCFTAKYRPSNVIV